MIRVRVTHTVDSLDRDMRRLPERAANQMATLVRRNAEVGNRRAKKFATASSGRHGHWYPTVFNTGAVGNYSWEYGPDASIVRQGKKGAFMPGGMAPGFEWGSRNQPPHMDLAKSADIIAPKMAADVRKMIDRLFW